MISANNLRRIAFLVDGKWVNGTLAQIEPGDVFKMYNPDNTLVTSENGNTIFRATTYCVIEVDEFANEEDLEKE